MILRNAENIYPIEIEYRLDAHPSVAESAVVRGGARRDGPRSEGRGGARWRHLGGQR